MWWVSCCSASHTTRAWRLEVAPRLESWERAGHPSQQALLAYLEHVEAAVAPNMRQHAGHAVALRLTAGLPADVALIGAGGDLDNYLYPVVRRLGADRVASAWARKLHGGSSICVQAAAPAVGDATAGWNSARARTTRSSQSRGWKGDIAAQLPPAVAPEGTVELQIAFRAGPQRNWTALWKPAIDALGAILRVDDAIRPFSPRDDRITRLGLHHNMALELDHAVELGVWWRRATCP